MRGALKKQGQETRDQRPETTKDKERQLPSCFVSLLSSRILSLVVPGLYLTMGLSLVALMAIGAWAIDLTVVGMGEGNVVSDVVRLNVSAPSSPEGYAVLKVDGAFVEAQAPPFSFQWDTSGVADGPHVVLVQEIGEDGSLVDEAQASLRVSNRLQVAAPVRLEYRLAAASQANYEYDGYSDLMDADRRDYRFVPSELYRAVAGHLTAAVRESFSAGAEGATQVAREVQSAVVEFPDRYARPEGVGQAGAFVVAADGKLSEGAEPMRPEALSGVFYIPVPTEPVSLGQSWKGPLWAALEFQQGRAVSLPATHELVDFVQVRGERCAVIRSRAEQRGPLSIAVESGSRDLDDASTEVTRTTYFSLDSGRVLRAVEDAIHEFAINASDYSISVAGPSLGGPRVPGVAVPSASVPREIHLEYAVHWRGDRVD